MFLFVTIFMAKTCVHTYVLDLHNDDYWLFSAFIVYS